MKLKDKNVLITGGSGFIGSHLTQKLVDRGANLRAFIRYNFRNDRGLLEKLSDNVKDEIDFYFGDLKDPESVRSATKGRDVVFHLGAVVSVPYSYKNPYDFVQTNVLGTTNVMNASKDFGVEKVIHTSTSEAYGTAQYTPIDEEHPKQGQSPYSATKIGADKITRSYYRSFDLPIAIIRPFNTYGPRQSTRAVIPTIITQALTQDYVKLGSLHPRRDLMYVKDTVNGFIKAAESDQSIGEVINVGTGSDVSIGDLAETIFGLIGKEPDIRTDQKRVRPEKSEVERLLCDNSKAKELIGWVPEYSLEEGLEETIEWFNQAISERHEEFQVGHYNV